MKKKRFLALAVVAATILSLTGCGTPLYDLTEEEEAIIVKYSAHVISKYNVFQRDGMNSVLPEIQEEETETVEESTESIEESTEAVDGNVASSNGADSGAEQFGGSISLGEALNFTEGLDITYNGFEMMPSYKEGSYYAIEAGVGYSYLVMNFTLTNNSSEACDVDLFSDNLQFSAKLDSDEKIAAESNFLTYSIVNYEGTVEAGESVELILLFKVTDTAEPSTIMPELYLDKDGSIYSVNL